MIFKSNMPKLVEIPHTPPPPWDSPYLTSSCWRLLMDITQASDATLAASNREVDREGTGRSPARRQIRDAAASSDPNRSFRFRR